MTDDSATPPRPPFDLPLLNQATGAQKRMREALRDAVCEYMDEGLITELVSDLEAILREEESDFLLKAGAYQTVRERLFK